MRPALIVPLVDLRAGFEPIRAEVLREFESVLDGMQLMLGPQQRAFEEEFARYCGVAHGVALSSGTDALLAALLACGVGAGDEVICPSHTFFATVEAIVHTGAVPVLVDVEADTLTLDPERVRDAVGPATRAIVPVHLYGHSADMDPILEIARQHGLRVIEDAAQAHGARYKGRRCGSLGDVGCFSFYFTKNLGAFGEGGFAATGDPELAERMRLLRHHGHTSKFEHQLVGYNLRMDELQAAVLRLKLPHLDRANTQRREAAERYRRALEGLAITLPSTRAACENVHHVYPIRVRERDALIEHLSEHGIGTGIHYKIPAHRQPALRAHPHRHGVLEITDRACAELVSLPMYPDLTAEQTAYVAEHVREFLVGGGSPG